MFLGRPLGLDLGRRLCADSDKYRRGPILNADSSINCRGEFRSITLDRRMGAVKHSRVGMLRSPARSGTVFAGMCRGAYGTIFELMSYLNTPSTLTGDTGSLDQSQLSLVHCCS
jgi:hypothetical protein